MSAPFFSVVMDNFNYARFVSQAIDSILAQDFPHKDVEIIVVDDGSTDDSRDVVGRYKDRVRLIAQENRGQAGAFATGFAAAKGQVVACIDSDDTWHPNKLSAVAEAIEKPGIGIVQHFQRDVDVEGRPLPNSLPDWPDVDTLDDFLDGRFINAAVSSLAFRRDVLVGNILPVPKDLFYLHDDYLLKYGLFFTNIANIRRILGYHRIHGSNNWAQLYLSPKKLEDSVREIRKFRGYMEERLKARGKAFSARYDAIEQMEVRKREILLAMHRGDRGEAARAWRSLFKEYGTSSFGFFKSATCALALVSPAFYLKAYDLYSRQHWLARARRRVLAEG
ncbi:MAG: glycosyltransferase [Elusimicrobia bacterium]|nr:glycosyltransferase [Elusimicrobiota bacterium]